MILANKNRFACYYNNIKEKDELEATLIDGECRVFSDYDSEKAKKYANSKVIKGFRTNEMNSYEILKELKKEGTSIIKFKTKEDAQKIVVLNDMYVLCTKDYLKFDTKTNSFLKTQYTGYACNLVNNFIDSIKDYAAKSKMPLFLAIYQYISTFHKVYGFYPWKVIQASDFYFDENDLPFGDDDICFEYIGDDITEHITIPKFDFFILNTKSNIRYREHQVNEIKEFTLHFNIEDKSIIKIIETDFLK